MKFHIEPVQFIVRGYEEGSFENKDPFDFVLNLIKISDTEAYAFAGLGKVPNDIRTALGKALIPYGISNVKFQRSRRSGHLTSKYTKEA